MNWQEYFIERCADLAKAYNLVAANAQKVSRLFR
jgi:hypothetical protein